MAKKEKRKFTEKQLLDTFANNWSSEGFISRQHEEQRFAAGKAALKKFLDEWADPEDSARALADGLVAEGEREAGRGVLGPSAGPDVEDVGAAHGAAGARDGHGRIGEP